ncbi:TPA: tail fiber assembly protein [Escherichia coli]|nr:tail fiber assembly protein [Escherichia coli]
MLPQHSNIEIAWYASIQQEPNGWKTVTTQFYIQEFSEYIAPLQDAVDLEIATEEERSLLEAWNKYRVLLNRVDTSTVPDIEWPANPVRE